MKLDLNVNRNITYQMAPYESIRPGVNITVKDVPSDKVQDVYYALDKIVSNLMRLETARMVESYYETKGFEDMSVFSEKVSDMFDEIEKEIKSDLKVISDEGESEDE